MFAHEDVVTRLLQKGKTLYQRAEAQPERTPRNARSLSHVHLPPITLPTLLLPIFLGAAGANVFLLSPSLLPITYVSVIRR